MPRRLAGWDYATAGVYFITICTRHRQPVFGVVEGPTVRRSALGALVGRQVDVVFGDRAGVHLQQWMLMHDHVHLIVALEPTLDQRHSVVALVAEFKARVTYAARKEGCFCTRRALWQRGFFDRVIRSDAELRELREYVETNPLRWSLRAKHAPPLV